MYDKNDIDKEIEQTQKFEIKKYDKEKKKYLIKVS